MNTITGPPLNQAITPAQHLALVSNSLDWVKDGGLKGRARQQDLRDRPDCVAARSDRHRRGRQAGLEQGDQPRRNFARVANRAEDSDTVLAIDGKSVKVVDTRSTLSPLHRAPRRPQRCALPLRSRLTVNMCSSSKGGANRAGWLDIDGQTVSYAQVDGKNYDMATGLNPLNVQVAADGKLAIVNNIGGGQDGQVDTVGMIDLEASALRVIDQAVVGDGPEGLAMSPAGGYVASLILNGTAPKTTFYRHEKSYVALLKIE